MAFPCAISLPYGWLVYRCSTPHASCLCRWGSRTRRPYHLERSPHLICTWSLNPDSSQKKSSCLSCDGQQHLAVGKKTRKKKRTKAKCGGRIGVFRKENRRYIFRCVCPPHALYNHLGLTCQIISSSSIVIAWPLLSNPNSWILSAAPANCCRGVHTSRFITENVKHAWKYWHIRDNYETESEKHVTSRTYTDFLQSKEGQGVFNWHRSPKLVFSRVIWA